MRKLNANAMNGRIALSIIPLVVLYWAIFNPLHFGLGKAFIAGLLLEATQSLVIGQAALGIIIITSFALANHRRLQLASLPQQILTITLILLFYQFIQIWIESLIERPSAVNTRLITAFVSALVWPGIIVFIRSLILRHKIART